VSFVCRHYSTSDLSAVRIHFARCWQETYVEQIGEKNVAIMIDGLQTEDIGGIYSAGGELFYVAEIDSEIVGTCAGISRHGVAYVWGCYVRNDHQRMGIATTLLREMVTHLDDVRVVEVTVLDSSEPARKFYRSLGFAETNASEFEMVPGIVMNAHAFEAALDILVNVWVK
jgi:ribosomal protein S18 acetylase RimI-like enzyme